MSLNLDLNSLQLVPIQSLSLNSIHPIIMRDDEPPSQVGWWEVGSEGGEESAEGGVVEGVARTSHSAAVQGDSMWVVGGEFLHRAPPGSMVSI